MSEEVEKIEPRAVVEYKWKARAQAAEAQVEALRTGWREAVNTWVREDLSTGAKLHIGYFAPKLIERLAALSSTPESSVEPDYEAGFDWKAAWYALDHDAARSRAQVDALSRPITMQDVRLAAGEGKLSAADVLTGCNAELRRRAALSAPAEARGDQPEGEA